MCSILGSYYQETIEELAEVNRYRGEHSHSVFVFNENGEAIYRHKAHGPLDITRHNLPLGYIVAHQQAPTTEQTDESAIHPAQVNDSLLWHNGIVKSKDVARLQTEHSCTDKWDTRLILKEYIKHGTVEGINGTFACLLVHGGEFLLFRNEISPLFMNERGDISSTRYGDLESIEPNTIFKVKFGAARATLKPKATFTTKENPYFFM